ncbi:hypothetical protein I8748_27700 [Nostoc sp. CENA67]|uniref:Uncharacterized protein n=1 Tax=Amazonocrinis nigriterrae CENA67 TaxID=2794033 RepID=A0A8J7HYQ3_9NOST|nr:hypothetical protein [Amazonocrinis nigriterrae]MBH8565907.1 hypothetical protein [Amazonocrinis nigriterrae CENA67]
MPQQAQTSENLLNSIKPPKISDDLLPVLKTLPKVSDDLLLIDTLQPPTENADKGRS